MGVNRWLVCLGLCWLIGRAWVVPVSMPVVGDAEPVVPEGVSVIKDVPYGAASLQRFDVYVPAGVSNAHVIVMVHGGAWRVGDKGASSVVGNKVAHWVSKGFVLVSVNYRLLPLASPIEQARDVAMALRQVQLMAGRWGGDAEHVVLMGHSAGAHLVGLLNASPQLAIQEGARKWRGAVLLDSAALDVEGLMQARHMRIYDYAFGHDQALWPKVSPLAQLSPQSLPFLAVCSLQRETACEEGRLFAQKARSLKVRGDVLPEDLSHMEINRRLGLDGDYTTGGGYVFGRAG